MGSNRFCIFEAQDAQGAWWTLADSSQEGTAWYQRAIGRRAAFPGALDALTRRDHHLSSALSAQSGPNPLASLRIGGGYGALWRGAQKRSPSYAWPKEVSPLAKRYKGATAGYMAFGWIDRAQIRALQGRIDGVLSTTDEGRQLDEDQQEALSALRHWLGQADKAFSMLLGTAKTAPLFPGFLAQVPRTPQSWDDPTFPAFEGPSAHATLSARAAFAALRDSPPALERQRLLVCYDL